MGIEQYDKFLNANGHRVRYSDIDIAEIDEYDQFWMPTEILEFLSEEGVSSYQNQFLWTMNPAAYVEVVNELLDFEERCIPFMRSAFGDLLFLRERNICVTNVSAGKISLMTDNFSSFVNGYLTDDWFYDSFFNGDLFRQLENIKLGPDKCLGFDLLLSEGGSRVIKSLSRQNLGEYLKAIAASSTRFGF